jgi:hypothetical protein
MFQTSQHDSPVLVHAPDTISFSLVIEETARSGEQPSFEKREVLIDVAARGVKCLSRTGVKLSEIVK